MQEFGTNGGLGCVLIFRFSGNKVLWLYCRSGEEKFKEKRWQTSETEAFSWAMSEEL